MSGTHDAISLRVEKRDLLSPFHGSMILNDKSHPGRENVTEEQIKQNKYEKRARASRLHLFSLQKRGKKYWNFLPFSSSETGRELFLVG